MSARVVIVIVGLLFGAAAAAAPAARRDGDRRIRKKLIATGWDAPDSARLLENLAQMEERPFDGVVIHLTGHTAARKAIPLARAFTGEAWDRAWFQACVDRLKACRSDRLTENFVLVGANPGDVDWFDDAGWAAVAEHWRIAAWIARQGGMRGILFDPEPYTPPSAQFRYGSQAERDRRPFEAYDAKARERGRQVMAAVAAEYPDATIFSYFMNSVVGSATGHADPRRALATLGYGLLPAFIDGWLDAAPPAVTLVDGCESAYRYNSERQYLESAVLIKGACQELVSPENRAKYRAQVQVSFGVYLDAYWNPNGPWYIDGLGGPRVERLRANVATALRVADTYVWIYGEKFRWWPTPNGRVRAESWPEALPGCDDVLRYVRDPEGFARSSLAGARAEGNGGNLARNGDFGAATAASGDGASVAWREGGPPAGWGAWQEEGSSGTFTWDHGIGARGPGAARASRVGNGCFLQHINVEPGQRYVLRAACRRTGAGNAWGRIRWQTAEGAWTAEERDALLLCDKTATAWEELFGVAEVPEGAGRLVVLLGVRGQTSPDDTVWFDDVELYRLP